MPLPIKSLHVRTKRLQRVIPFTEEKNETFVTVKYNQLLGAGDAYWNLAEGIILKYESKDIPHIYKFSTRVVKNLCCFDRQTTSVLDEAKRGRIYELYE